MQSTRSQARQLPGESHLTRALAPLAETVAVAGFDHLYIRNPRRWLAVILLAYLLVASLYAVWTPAWQTPDEPAHYNYIATIAAGNGLPVLRLGDYDQALLEQLLRLRFPSERALESLRYESYQPPLYYLLAAPVFWLSNGDLLALRLFSVAIGAIAILSIYSCLAFVFPQKHLITLGATAFVALLPMHVAMSAAVNNDGLAELLTIASISTLIYWMRGRLMVDAAPSAARQGEVRRLLLLGVLLGLGMLTKIYGHMVLVVSALVVFVMAWRYAPPVDHGNAPRRLVPAMKCVAWMLLPALLLALPMWLRNMYLYGVQDFLGLGWHDQVVAGQARTNQWVAVYGWVAYGERAFNFTFQSFWGVFGWLGLFMDPRIYTAFFLATGVLFMGLLWAVVRLISGQPDTDMGTFQIVVLILFGVILAAVTLSFIWYNTKFVQHQGRYFFWGLLPIGTFVALAWREVLYPIQGAITGFLAAVLAGALAVTGFVSGAIDMWTVLIIGLIALFLLLQPLLLIGTRQIDMRQLPASMQTPAKRRRVTVILSWLRSLAWTAPFILLFLLNVLIPRWLIFPQLAP